MRAYSTKDGTILWTFDTNREFQTVNGVKANGGGIEGAGAIVGRRFQPAGQCAAGVRRGLKEDANAGQGIRSILSASAQRKRTYR